MTDPIPPNAAPVVTPGSPVRTARWFAVVAALALLVGGGVAVFSNKVTLAGPGPEPAAVCEHLMQLGESRPEDRNTITTLLEPEFLFGEPAPRAPSVEEQCLWYFNKLKKKEPAQRYDKKAACALDATTGPVLAKCFHP